MDHLPVGQPASTTTLTTPPIRAASKLLSTSLIARGILAVIVGIIALAWPAVTVLALVILLAVYAPRPHCPQKVATAVINLVLGAAIGSLINGTAARVIRRRAITGG